MKRSFILLFGAMLLAGCAQEAIYADHEFGIATQNAFDQQIVHKDGKYANKPVDQMDGLYSEHIMGTYLNTFSQGSTRENIAIGESGVAND
jgi:hypothetical protein